MIVALDGAVIASRNGLTELKQRDMDIAELGFRRGMSYIEKFIADNGYIIVKRDSVVSRRRTDKELVQMLKDRGLEK